MSVVPSDLGELPAPSMPRRRQLLFGTAFVAGACAMFILTLLGLYLQLRSGNRAVWLKNNTLQLTQPNVILFTLLMSSVTAQWATYSIARDDRPNTYLASGMTMMFGLAAIVQTWFLYDLTGIKVAQLEGGVFYALTGAHLAMLIGALAFFALMTLRSFGGSFSSRYPEGFSAATLFWHSTVALYTVVWLAVYIMK
jgi:heme/copper-type cytochrome/quinol oxidase subunit 3